MKIFLLFSLLLSLYWWCLISIHTKWSGKYDYEVNLMMYIYCSHSNFLKSESSEFRAIIHTYCYIYIYAQYLCIYYICTLFDEFHVEKMRSTKFALQQVLKPADLEFLYSREYRNDCDDGKICGHTRFLFQNQFIPDFIMFYYSQKFILM